MKLVYPLGFLTAKAEKWSFAVLFLLALILMACLQVLDGPLVTEVAPMGIVSFELAGDLGLARQMVDSWGPEGRVYAGLSLGLDYLFMVVYALAIMLGCILVSKGLAERLAGLAFLGAILAWGQIGAALLDALENYALILILLGTNEGIWALVARWAALPKFAIVLLGIAYILLGAIVNLVMKPKAAAS